MSLTTGVFLVILAFFTWRGYQKGFIGAITKLLSFIIAYPAAIFFTKPFATILRGWTGLDGLVLFLVAGCSIFLVASLLVTLVLNSIARAIPSNQFTDTGSKIGGTAFGVTVGTLVGLVVVYLIGITRPHTQTIATAEKIPPQKHITAAEADSIQKYVVPEDAPVKDSFIDTTAKKLVSTAASTAVGVITSDNASKQLTKSMAQDPQAMLNHVQNIVNDGEFKQLLGNPEFQSELNKGNAAALTQSQEFQALMQNPDMRAIIASSENSDAASQQAAAEKMIQAWQRVETLKNDPRVLHIVSDPAFQAQLNSPNKLPLLMNPGMRELSEIIFSSDSSPARSDNTSSHPQTAATTVTRYEVEDITNGLKQSSENNDNANAKEADKVPEQKLYRWTDEDGKVHYSDKPIKY
jgi:uncharacterized membrane protein required for colicin V production